MSEHVLQQKIKNAVEEALYEQRTAEALRPSRSDFEDGHYYSSREDLMGVVSKKRAAHA